MAVNRISNLTEMHTIRIYLAETRAETNEIDINVEKIYKSDTLMVTTPIPSNFTMSVGGQYSSWFDSGVAESLNTVLNAIGITNATKWSSTPIWDKADPFSIDIPILLVAQENAQAEVYTQILKLLSLASPSVFKGGFTEGLLIPTGPDILTEVGKQLYEVAIDLQTGLKKAFGNNEVLDVLTTGLANTASLEWAKWLRQKLLGNNRTSRTISIEIGNFLRFEDMIITSINTTWGKSDVSILPMNNKGFPVIATIALKLRGTKIMTDNGSDLYSTNNQIARTKSAANYPEPVRGGNGLGVDLKPIEDIYRKFL